MAKETVIATYQVRQESELAFRQLIERHWRTLSHLGFATDTPAQVFRSQEEPPTYVEVFTWNEGGPELAHQHPDVIEIWEALEPLVEARNGLPARDFPRFAQLHPSV